MKKNLWLLGLLVFSSLLGTGCTTTVTNLTPSTQQRNPNGLYPFEVTLDNQLTTIRRSTLQPFVLIGAQAYPMQPTPDLKDRWETLVPISADKEYVNYRFKFNYDYNRIPHPEGGSKLSAPYQVRIIDKPAR